MGGFLFLLLLFFSSKQYLGVTWEGGGWACFVSCGAYMDLLFLPADSKGVHTIRSVAKKGMFACFAHETKEIRKK
jgi:hypothetical protein